MPRLADRPASKTLQSKHEQRFSPASIPDPRHPLPTAQGRDAPRSRAARIPWRSTPSGPPGARLDHRSPYARSTSTPLRDTVRSGPLAGLPRSGEVPGPSVSPGFPGRTREAAAGCRPRRPDLPRLHCEPDLMGSPDRPTPWPRPAPCRVDAACAQYCPRVLCRCSPCPHQF